MVALAATSINAIPTRVQYLKKLQWLTHMYLMWMASKRVCRADATEAIVADIQTSIKTQAVCTGIKGILGLWTLGRFASHKQ